MSDSNASDGAGNFDKSNRGSSADQTARFYARLTARTDPQAQEAIRRYTERKGISQQRMQSAITAQTQGKQPPAKTEPVVASDSNGNFQQVGNFGTINLPQQDDAQPVSSFMMPTPPDSGDYALTSSDGEMSWTEIDDCPDDGS